MEKVVKCLAMQLCMRAYVCELSTTADHDIGSKNGNNVEQTVKIPKIYRGLVNVKVMLLR